MRKVKWIIAPVMSAVFVVSGAFMTLQDVYGTLYSDELIVVAAQDIDYDLVAKNNEIGGELNDGITVEHLDVVNLDGIDIGNVQMGDNTSNVAVTEDLDDTNVVSISGVDASNTDANIDDGSTDVQYIDLTGDEAVITVGQSSPSAPSTSSQSSNQTSPSTTTIVLDDSTKMVTVKNVKFEISSNYTENVLVDKTLGGIVDTAKEYERTNGMLVLGSRLGVAMKAKDVISFVDSYLMGKSAYRFVEESTVTYHNTSWITHLYKTADGTSANLVGVANVGNDIVCVCLHCAWSNSVESEFAGILASMTK